MGMTPKKVHEVPLLDIPIICNQLHRFSTLKVVQMSTLVARVCKTLGVDTVVDIGAGEVWLIFSSEEYDQPLIHPIFLQGYVSHILAQHHGLRVIAVEGNESYLGTLACLNLFLEWTTHT